MVMTMAKRQLSNREQAVLKGLLILKDEDKQLLDRFYIRFMKWSDIAPLLAFRTDTVSNHLQIYGSVWQVHLLSPISELIAAKEIGCSFRQNTASNFYHVLVKEWKRDNG